MQYERFEGRWFLKSNWHLVKAGQSDQSKGVPVPLQEEPPAPEDCVIDLPPPNSLFGGKVVDAVSAAGAAVSGTTGSAAAAGVESSRPARAAVLYNLLRSRKSRRKYSADPLALEELSYLLWAVEGVKENRGRFSFRTTPSGARATRSTSMYLPTKYNGSMWACTATSPSSTSSCSSGRAMTRRR